MNRHIPQRTCLACGAVRPKHELLRIVRCREDEFMLDPDAGQPGRGAYVCRRLECAEALARKNGLARAFRRPVSRQNQIYKKVIEYLHGDHR